LDSTIKNFDPHRPSYKGLIIYAVDSLQVTLPRSQDIANAGYTGRARAQYRESYMPKGFLTHTVDVVSGTTKDLYFTSSQTELSLAADKHYEDIDLFCSITDSKGTGKFNQ